MKERKKRFALFPGIVVSDDGDQHYVTAQRLAKLHGVRLDECIVVPYDPDRETGLAPVDITLQKLFPSSTGDYPNKGARR